MATSSEPSATSTVSLAKSEAPQSPLLLYPYQRKWINDKSRRKIAVKSRRIGYSFGEGFAKVCACIEQPMTSIVLSRGERQAKQFIEQSVAPHVRAIGVVAEFISAELPQSSIRKQEVTFGNGSRIIALPANPETARSYEGDVTLDEFAFHRDARKIYEAIGPSITRGFSLSIISTPNGQLGAYYEMAREAGLVEATPATSDRWSAHSTNLLEAAAQGCLDKNGRPISVEEIRLDCHDDEMWLQEFMCKFLSLVSQWISPDLFESCISDSARDGALLDDEAGDLFFGWDIARNRDLSVVWILKRIPETGGTITRGVVEFHNMPLPQQKREATAMMQRGRRMAIDKTGMGLALAEELAEKFYGKIEGVQFTQATKEELAVNGKKQMEYHRTLLPDTDKIRNSFRSVKKSTTATGQARFDAEHDEKYGHADHWWAYCLAQSAAGTPALLGVVEYVKRKEREEVEKVQTSRLIKPETNAQTETCPNPDCGSKAIVRVAGGQKRCNQCGVQWGAANQAGPAGQPKRGDFVK